ncbi:MAG: T9SS type A sorting domain-containing protein [Aureispira sp.]|nr:T9SS type A sorting domain-containing protein [Aureispira sp.]
MNFTRFMSVVLAMFLALATTPAHTMSTTEAFGQLTSVKEKPLGGIRDIYILPLSLLITQEFPSVLNIKIYDEEGKVVYSTSSEDLEIPVNTSNFASGTYNVVTIAAGESESQDFEVNL